MRKHETFHTRLSEWNDTAFIYVKPTVNLFVHFMGLLVYLRPSLYSSLPEVSPMSGVPLAVMELGFSDLTGSLWRPLPTFKNYEKIFFRAKSYSESF